MAFSKCTDCVKYKTIIANTKDPVEKSYARAKLATHHQRVTTERQFTELNLAKSRTDEDFFFCEIDGMDSSKTLVPRSVVKDKNTLPDYLLKTHVTCVKYNGRRPDHVYLYTEAFPHDSANTSTIIYLEIMKVNKVHKTFTSQFAIISAFLLVADASYRFRLHYLDSRIVL